LSVERSIPVVSRDIKINVAVVVVINKGQSEIQAATLDARGFGHTLKRAVLFVVQQQDAPVKTHG